MVQLLRCGFVLLLAGCATRPVADEAPAGSYNIGRQLLAPEQKGGAGAIEPYVLGATETFRMPEPQHAPSPTLPPGYERQTLLPTTLCVRVIVMADGSVERVEPLRGHARCSAGVEQEHASLLQAALDATARWTFLPAAICRFAPGTGASAPGNCSGATGVEAVPVTLLYGFTFEVEQGRARVRSSSDLH
ncbi:energy transducer TonB [Stenotrophomonas sp. JC08]|uniref:energy transducer TonB n=1 Tax=Stenotrophomonas sp. JC08 TaxID=3445779 RepID=UPI003FA238A1